MSEEAVEQAAPDQPPADQPADPTPPEDNTPANYFGSVPDSWRTDLVAHAGLEGDEAKAFSNVLERVTDFGAFAKNYKQMQDKIRAGELSSGLPENPTDEQLAAWREANGVPQDGKGYELNLAEGVELDPDQQEIFAGVYDAAAGLNINNDQMSGIVNAYKQVEQQIIEKQQAQDGVDQQMGVQMLKENWGADYQTNINLIDAKLNLLPESVRDTFKSARLADGRALLNSPEVMMFLAETFRQADPAATVVPGDANPSKTIQQEIAALEARMGTPEWYKDNGAQQRYIELVEARNRMAG